MNTTSNILALDASSSKCSVALTLEGRTLVRSASNPRQAAQLLLPMTRELLSESKLELQQLDAIAVASGPGSFTGLRIAIGVAQGLSLAANLPVVPLSNLAILSFMALENCDKDAALACLEARDGEVYFAAYRRDLGLGVKLIGVEQVAQISELEIESLASVEPNCWIAVGDAFAEPQRIEQRTGIEASVGIVHGELAIEQLCKLASLQFAAGKSVPSEEVQPNYIKEQLDYS
ncbi:MAG: tRNA (adenosine(37)-N6)-threonylcarbamoyltransferase complex dimerization subunit type 1 TsaB [Pseudohongiellaceae bacterium]